jgi:hypothetical protein
MEVCQGEVHKANKQEGRQEQPHKGNLVDWDYALNNQKSHA